MEIFLSILIGLATILLLVTFHEFAHFLIAKMSGAYVYEFSIGMGPKLFQWGKKETRYTLRLLPLGGYVSIASEIADPPKGREEEKVDEKQLLENIHRGKKAMFVSAGAIMNLLVAFLLLILAYSIYPYKQDLSLPPTFLTYQGPTLAAVNKYNSEHTNKIANGTTIKEVKVDGTSDSVIKDVSNYYLTNNNVNSIEYTDFVRPKNYTDLANWIKNSLDTVPAQGNYVYITFSNEATVSFALSQAGSKGNYVLGVTASNRHLSAGQVVGDGIVDTFKNSYSILQALGQLVTFHWSNLSGPVGIVKSANVFLNKNVSSTINASTYFRWAALLSANLFLLNMLPIPPLDGYKFLENAVEAARRKKLNSKLKIIVTVAGAILFLGIFVAITIKDIWF